MVGALRRQLGVDAEDPVSLDQEGADFAVGALDLEPAGRAVGGADDPRHAARLGFGRKHAARDRQPRIVAAIGGERAALRGEGGLDGGERHRDQRDAADLFDDGAGLQVGGSGEAGAAEQDAPLARPVGGGDAVAQAATRRLGGGIAALDRFQLGREDGLLRIRGVGGLDLVGFGRRRFQRALARGEQQREREAGGKGGQGTHDVPSMAATRTVSQAEREPTAPFRLD